jgi:hypothetical protein
MIRQRRGDALSSRRVVIQRSEMDKQAKGEQVEEGIYLLPGHFYLLTRRDRHDESEGN